MTWGAVILALTGLLLVFLAISGVIIWWPGLRRLRSRFRVRIGKGRFARDYDLHRCPTPSSTTGRSRRCTMAFP
ncbi:MULTISPECIES: PepSY domain-containing protein [Gordonia]|uniref:PepSY domain-containing protein n=1 Tax=Gordonia TaxID=2053 RepID=UPI000B0C6D18|nr:MULTISPECIES: PepSY domain-containing protein [Gordonia]MCM3897796.1 PepSY domain-containing protein [Gordonia sputi]